jgi:hypothetical protein
MGLPRLLTLLAGVACTSAATGPHRGAGAHQGRTAQGGGRRLRLTDTARQRRAMLAHPRGRRPLQEVATIATEETTGPPKSQTPVVEPSMPMVGPYWCDALLSPCLLISCTRASGGETACMIHHMSVVTWAVRAMPEAMTFYNVYFFGRMALWHQITCILSKPQPVEIIMDTLTMPAAVLEGQLREPRTLW